MSKHNISPPPLPLSKRPQILASTGCRTCVQPTTNVTFDASLYDELILYIFSYLSWVDLCAVQSTNKKWSRLAADNQLWKALYIREYGRTRLRGTKGFDTRADGREVRPLPRRATTNDVRDWKFMFRISSNWRTGRCVVERWRDCVDKFPASPQASTSSHYRTHILLTSNVTITASSRPCPSPEIYLHTPDQPAQFLSCGLSGSQEPIHITALALDQSPPDSENHMRIASFLSSGAFSVFVINHRSPPHPVRQLTYAPAFITPRTSPIIQAVYHQPLLITLSQVFHLSIYDLSSDTISHKETLTSFTSFPPTSLVLSSPSVGSYKLVLAYAIPVYPVHWTVGATELIISGTSLYQDAGPTGLNSLRVITTRTTRAFEVPSGWLNDSKLQFMREQWGRKVPRVADTQTDGKWVVLAPATARSPSSAPPSPSPSTYGPLLVSSRDTSPFVSSSVYSSTSLQLYRLSFPSSHRSSSSVPKLTFIRNLTGPVGPVSTLALADGRCVCLSVNGSIWVWDLENGTGTEVAKASFLSLDAEIETQGSVVFDERRIISAGLGGVAVRKFDI